jgi:hypothetical protein
MLENLQRTEKLETASDRKFGLLFAVVFTIIGLLPLLHDHPTHLWAFIVALIFLVTTFLFPKALHPLNKLWMRFGLLLHMIISPIALGIIYYLVIVPFGLFFKLTGHDFLKRKLDDKITSYWIARTPPGPEPKQMSNQF